MALSFFNKKRKEQPTKPLLKVEEVIRETNDTVTLVFGADHASMPYKAGQFLTLSFNLDGKEVRRAYSLCSSPESEERLAVTVKRVEGGLVSNHINDNIKVGDELEFLPPEGTFVFEPEHKAERPVVLFAAGSGITPLMSILKTALRAESGSKVVLVYTNRNEESVIFQKELSALETEHDGRFEVKHYLTRPSGEWTGKVGRLDVETVKAELDGINGEAIYYSCGPEGMMQTVTDTLLSMGVSESRIRKERFVPVENPGASEDGEPLDVPVEIIVAVDGDEYEVTVSPDQTILEAALEADVDMPYSCQSGLCTACKARCVEGKVSMEETDALTPEEVEAGDVLTCVCAPLSEGVKIIVE
ncbi:phenylacetic acid degradation protein [Fulvitalea axinellae]|uniref:Phenylacetic acid degradation protein n=1 Tax=Fulvitalea axinellae TaxID=1182444 RepID=A0AAU9CYQ2_9BACT|nr:phenylacetic acid degradation protein [Fulvitalea axinellae]